MSQAGASSAFRPDGASFPVRRVDFDFAEMPKFIYDDSPLESCFWLVVQALFPHGEQFFIDAVRDCRDKVDDPQLQAAIRAFMGQEANHGRAHRKANEAIMKAHGLDVMKTERRTKVAMSLFNRFHTPMQRLAMTVGAEHFTSTLARYMLRHREYVAGFRHPEVSRLIMWHALEEREHRAVAFDLYERAGGGYWMRVTMMPWFIGWLLPFVAYEVVRLLVENDGLRDRAALARAARSLGGRDGVLRKLGPGMRDYFRRDFHPSDDDQSELEEAWRRELAFGT